MIKIETFLKSNIYPLMVAIIGFIAWALPANFLWLNNTLIILLVVISVLILAFFKNTKYIIPILLSLLFMINIEKIGVEDLSGFTVYHLMLILVLVGLTVHFVRFKYEFKFDFIALGLLLIAISYFIPMSYMPVSSLVFSVSLTGLLYLLFYLFFKSTAKVTTAEVLNYFFFAALQLLAILVYSMGTNFFELILENNLEETFSKGIKTGWGGADYGFGNINDLTIHLAILSSGIFYKILKNSKNHSYWIFAVISSLTVIFSGSRGGAITLALILFVYYIMLFVYGKKPQILIGNALIILFGLLAFIYKDIFLILYENFIQGGFDDLDKFSSGRIQLYKEAIEVFKQYPVFGAGWTTFEANNIDRLQVFHSTVFHTLAISGIFGMFAVFVFTIACLATLLKKISLNVLILGVPWTMTMLHGLFDNTIHMVIYTILTIILFTAVQNEEENLFNKDKEFFKYFTYK